MRSSFTGDPTPTVGSSPFPFEFQEKMTGKFGADKFKSEVYQKCEIENDEINLIISGRIDGVLYSEESIYIYEIKSVAREIETIAESEFPVHWAQAECYAWMLLDNTDKNEIYIRLVYINRDSRESKQFERVYSGKEIDAAFKKMVSPYIEWMAGIRKMAEGRTGSRSDRRPGDQYGTRGLSPARWLCD